MKTSRCLIVCLTALVSSAVFGQQAGPLQSYPVATAPGLTKFDLDFPGGTPGELVTAIRTAMGRPLNAIVPSEDAKLQLPPLKLARVDAAQLFHALLMASHHREVHIGTNSGHKQSYDYRDVYYGFWTSGPATDDSIWYFHNDRIFPLAAPPKFARFYLLTPYLNRGFTVDAVTSSIQTAWKMLGAPTVPDVSFQKDTNLLIAVGKPSQLDTIDAVLRALRAAPLTAAAPSK